MIYLEKSDVQSIIFDKDKFNLSQCINFLKRNGFEGLDVDEKENVYRFRQKNPKKYKRFRTKEIKDGVKFVFGFK